MLTIYGSVKMAKKLNATVPDWIDRDIVQKAPTSNKSEWIAELLVKGYETVKKDRATSPIKAVLFSLVRAAEKFLNLRRENSENKLIFPNIPKYIYH